MTFPFFIFGDDEVCTYCDNFAGETDHIIPVSQQTNERKINQNQRRRRFGPITYCCKSCNQRLGNKYFDTFLERWSYPTRNFFYPEGEYPWRPRYQSLTNLQSYLEKYKDHEELMKYFKTTLELFPK